MTGALRVAQASPDGYTTVLGTVGTHAQNQTLYKRPLYNAATDFTPVALIAEVPTVLIVRKDMPVNNLKEFVEYAKKNQEKMGYGWPGPGPPPISPASCWIPQWAPTSPMSRIAAPVRP